MTKNLKNNRKYTIILIMCTLLITTVVYPILSNNNTKFKPDQSNNIQNTVKTSGYWTLSYIHIDGNLTDTFVDHDWCIVRNSRYVIENVTIDPQGANTGIKIENSDLPFTIRNCTIINSSDETYQAAMFLNNTSNGIVRNNTMTDNDEVIYLYDNCENILIEENTLINNTGNTVYLYDGCINNTIRRNIIRRNANGIVFSGMMTVPCNNNSVVENIIEDHEEGIAILDCSEIRMIDNEIINATSYGIHFSQNIGWCNNHTVLGNTISESQYAIYSEKLGSWDFSNFSIIGNVLINNDYGLKLDSHNILNIESNQMENHTNSGIDLGNSEDITLEGNSITHSDFTGMSLSNCDECIIEDNTINQNTISGLTYSNSEKGVIENNSLNNNGYGIYGNNLVDINFSTNDIKNNNYTGFYLGLSSTNVHSAFNNISYNKEYGINVTGDASMRIIQSIVSFNEEIGIGVGGTVTVMDSYVWKNGDGKNEDQIYMEKYGSLFVHNTTIGHTSDADGDGLSDYEEITQYGTDYQNSDSDLDNLNDAFELKYGTDPLDDDTDGDGYYDGIEVQLGTNPLDPEDFPGKIDEDTQDDEKQDSGSPDSADQLSVGISYFLGGVILTITVLALAFFISRKRL